MAEKNTLSILETIKKKLHKFDQKTEKNNKISEVSAEFEYISPTKKPDDTTNVKIESGEKKNSNIVQNTLPKFEDDLGLEELNKPEEEVNKIASEASPTTQSKPDDFNLDDLDLDDESAIVKKPETPQISTSPTEAEEEEFVAEDYEDEVDLNEEAEVEQKIAEKETPAENNDLDFNFDEEEEVAPAVETKPQEQQAAENELNLNFDEEEEEAPTVESEPQEEPIKKEDDDLNFDDLELDEEDEKVTSEKQSQPTAELAKNEDIDLDELDKALAQQEATKKEMVKQKKAPSLDEINLEFEKEIMGFRPENQATPAVQPVAEVVIVPVTPEPVTPAVQPVAEVVIAPVTPEPVIPAVQPVAEVAAAPVIPTIPSTPEPVIPAVQSTTETITQASQEPVTQQIAAQDFFPILNQPIREEKSVSSIINDTTIMRTTESIKKLIDAKNVVTGISSFAQSPAFAELAIQLMEPKLERWLNENLPEVVEKIVREEIKKIIPKE